MIILTSIYANLSILLVAVGIKIKRKNVPYLRVMKSSHPKFFGGMQH